MRFTLRRRITRRMPGLSRARPFYDLQIKDKNGIKKTTGYGTPGRTTRHPSADSAL